MCVCVKNVACETLLARAHMRFDVRGNYGNMGIKLALTKPHEHTLEPGEAHGDPMRVFRLPYVCV